MTVAYDLRALTAAATPGPWKQGDGLACDELTVYVNDGAPRDHVAEAWGESDAELIVWLRNHADDLADLIDAANAASEDLGDCGDGGWGAGETCRSVYPDNPEEWCGPCLLTSALAAVEADR